MNRWHNALHFHRKFPRWLVGGIWGGLIFLIITSVAYQAKTTFAIIVLIPGMVVAMISSSWNFWNTPTIGEFLGTIVIFGVLAIPFAVAGAVLASGHKDQKFITLIFLLGYLAILSLCEIVAYSISS